ncbi:MAG: phage Gp37/Gp68 family protein [Vampirovibrionales bacterium]|nr:phage Gp37/Gp68 family protein [Vampirovibrionales bacterium]
MEWTHQRNPDGTVTPGFTFNPWVGCQKVSSGCKHCYAETLMDTRYGKVKWGPAGTRVRTSDANWRKPLTWNRQAEKEGRRLRVFCASLADVFEGREEVAPWRADLFELIAKTRMLDWLLLTKRPENIEPMLRAITTPGGTLDAWRLLETGYYSNVWLGTSVENQEAADERIPKLLAAPAKVRFLSCEPLLSPVDLIRLNGVLVRKQTHAILDDRGTYGMANESVRLPVGETGIHWVIVGGESGQQARPMNPEWARLLRDQCVDAGVPFFFKQWGEWGDPISITVTGRARAGWYETPPEGVNRHEFSGTMVGDVELRSLRPTVYRVGKAAAGRLLDGREWNETP